MNDKVIFFNTGWMDFYRGLSDDKIVGGGEYVKSMGWGHEMLNFQVFDDKLYGYVQPKIDRKFNNPSTIKLEKLGASKTEESIDNVTVIWTATDPVSRGTYIVGWYENATVFRYSQDPPAKSKRIYRNKPLGYFATTRAKYGKLLPVDERIVGILRKKKNWMGQSNVWYADKNPAFVKIVKDYIYKGVIPQDAKVGGAGVGTARQTDVLKRAKIEEKAILEVKRYYKKLGYEVETVEKDNVGWDLTATNNKTQLKLEVKGLSGSSISAELTPNEYKSLKANKRFYRICIVTNTLIKPVLNIFAYSIDNDHWANEHGTVIRLVEAISASVYL